ncbi:PARP1 (predicted), partial [Pycnogonum litorale]
TDKYRLVSAANLRISRFNRFCSIMSSSDLPFRVEYAKSGRASCKGCRQKIDKDSLRLARMVQSPMFDGKIPNWYHEDCFFPKAKVENFTDIAHLDSLRWEDQQRIKDKIGSSSGSKDTTDENLEEFQIEYAKSGKSKCLCCDEAIPKGEIRIGKTTHEGEKAMRFGPYKQWYHKNCFIKVREELEFRSGGDKLPGFKSLKDDDKKEVKNTLKPTKKRKTDSKKEAGGKKVKKEETEDDIQLKKQNKIMFKYRDQLKDLTKKELAELLEYNDQELAKGESALLDRLCDIMTFGAISPCKECDGQLVYSRGYYKCTGNMSEWTKCQLSTREISRTPFKVPDDLKEKYSFLNNYKYKNNVRIYPKDEDLPSTASTTTTTDSNGSQLSNKSTS